MNGARLKKALEDGIAHHRGGRIAEARACYRQILASLPNQFDALHLSGLAAYQQQRAAEAVELLTRALQIERKSDLCEMRLGLALMAVGRNEDAEKRLRAVVGRQPALFEAWENLALCLKIQNRLEEAAACNRRVVELRPESAAGWTEFGLTLASMGRAADALQCHDRAVALAPGQVAAHHGRGQALVQLHRVAEALEAFERVLSIEPGHLEARSYRLFTLHYVDGVSRERMFEEHAAYGRLAEAGAAACAVVPGPASGVFSKPEQAGAPSSAAAAAAAAAAKVPGGPGDTVVGCAGGAAGARRLRVGIVSPDLRAHSCAYFIEPLLRFLDRERFELFLYMDHFREDEVSERLRGLASAWRRLVGKSTGEAERIIRADAPDILIDLAGHAGMTPRLPLFARRVAPVQVAYLGYPDTTGLAAMDFRFTDGTADPEGDSDRFATERLVRFSPTAWAYQPPADAPIVSALPMADRFPPTFGCFNHPIKITDAQLKAWTRLLELSPGSRLCLKGAGFGTAGVRERYQRRFEAAGIDAARVILLERAGTTAEHLALYHRIDVALDTFPYHGTTTTCEALWMGVPVVSLEGDRHVSRVGSSLLGAVGHREWIARDAEEYATIAASLAANSRSLAGIRSRLRGEVAASALLDHAGQAARFADALERCCRGRTVEASRKVA